MMKESADPRTDAEDSRRRRLGLVVAAVLMIIAMTAFYFRNQRTEPDDGLTDATTGERPPGTAPPREGTRQVIPAPNATTPAPRAPEAEPSPPPVPRPTTKARAELAARLDERPTPPRPTTPPPVVVPVETPPVTAPDERPEVDPDEEPPPMEWSIDREGIRAAMDSVKPAIGECYEGWLAENPELGGKIVVSFRVAPDETGGEYGKITSISLPTAQTEHPLLEGCVLNAVVGLRFSTPEEPMTINYPFNLRAEESE